jgi:hypothetical protein
VIARGARALGWGLLGACAACVGDAQSVNAGRDGGVDAGAALDSGLGTSDSGSQADAGGPLDSGVTPDSGSSGSDGGTDAGSGTGCVGKSYLLCEDFESTAPGSIPSGWTPLPDYGTGTVGVALDQAHSGAHALKSSSASGGQPRIQASLASLGAAAGKHWGRIFYKVALPAPHPNAYFQVVFAGLLGTTESRVADTVEDPSGATIQYLYDLPDDSCCGGTNYNWSFDGQWHCAEWYVDNTTQSYRFFIDSSEVYSFTQKAGAKLEVFGALGIGQEFFIPPATPLTTWVDDVALDASQIGCQ